MHLYCHSGYPPCGSLIVMIAHKIKMGNVPSQCSAWRVQQPQPCTKPRIQLQGVFTSCAPHQYIREWAGQGCLQCVFHAPVTQYAGWGDPGLCYPGNPGRRWTLCQNYGAASQRHAFTLQPTLFKRPIAPRPATVATWLKVKPTKR